MELRRSTWPAWTEVRGTTLVVIVTVFLFAAYFYVVDLALNWFILNIMEFFGAS